MNALLIL